MSYQFRALQVSLAIHAAVFLSVLGMSNSLAPRKKTIGIDFILERSQSGRGRSESSSVRRDRPLRAAHRKEVQPTTTKKPVTAAQREKVQQHTRTAAPVPAGNTEAALSQAKDREASETQQQEGEVTASGAAGNPSSDGIDGNSKKEYLAEHLHSIRDMIHMQIRYPRVARRMGWEGKTMISFIIGFDGTVGEITVVESSGFEILDRSAVQAVKTASPLPKPPKAIQVMLPIVYRLKTAEQSG